MLKLCTSNKGLVWFTSSKIKICPTQNQMEPEANAFERCFALIRVLDIFQLPEVIFLEAVNHQSNQVGRFICLLLCQCTSVNCPLSKGCWSGNYRWSIYFAQYCCLTLWKYVNDTGEIHINTKEYQNKRSQSWFRYWNVDLLYFCSVSGSTWIGTLHNVKFTCQYIEAIFSFWRIFHIVARWQWQKFCTSFECYKIS